MKPQREASFKRGDRVQVRDRRDGVVFVTNGVFVRYQENIDPQTAEPITSAVVTDKDDGLTFAAPLICVEPIKEASHA